MREDGYCSSLLCEPQQCGSPRSGDAIGAGKIPGWCFIGGAHWILSGSNRSSGQPGGILTGSDRSSGQTGPVQSSVILQRTLF